MWPLRKLSSREIKIREYVRALYLSGLSTRQIAKSTGHDSAWVYRICSDIVRPHVKPESTNVRTAYNRGRRALEAKLGRSLTNKERVHYIDKNPLDCSFGNIEILTPIWHDKAHVNTYNRVWRKTHPSNWRAHNPDKAHAIGTVASIRRRKRLNVAAGSVNGNDWQQIKRHYDYTCLRCETRITQLTMDHVVPLFLGGEHLPVNIQPLCRSCNSIKHTTLIDYRLGSELMPYWHAMYDRIE